MSLYAELLNTAMGCGINVISERHAAQLMAVVYLYGDESTVYSDKLRDDIHFVQERYGLFGCGVPDMDFVSSVKRYVLDVRCNKHPYWMLELEQRYGISLPDYEEYEQPKPDWSK